MYDINIKNVKSGKKIFLIFLVLGLIFLIICVGVLVANYKKLNSLDSTVTASNIDVKSYINDEGTTMYSPVYYYQVDGIEYSCGSNSSSSVYPDTSKETVYYDSNNPAVCMTEYSKSSNKFIILVILLPIIFIAVGVFNICKVNKRVKLVLELNQKGKLVKNIPYHLEDTNMTVNNNRIQRIVIDYVLPSGSILTLYGDPRFDKKVSDADGMVDLVIDEQNPNNYFIDFEINRLSGNLISDYYNQVESSMISQFQQNMSSVQQVAQTYNMSNSTLKSSNFNQNVSQDLIVNNNQQQVELQNQDINNNL